MVMLAAMVWSTQGSRYESIFEAINKIAAHLAPPITTVFLWGIFWQRGTKQAALITLITGFSLGALAFLFEMPVIGHEKALDPPARDPLHDAGLVDVLPLQPDLCRRQPVNTASRPESGGGDDLEKSAPGHRRRTDKGLVRPATRAAVLLAIMVVLYSLLR